MLPIPERYSRETWQSLDTISEMLRRADILKQATGDPELQEALKEMCRRDYGFFFNNFCWIYDPRAGREHMAPWIFYPHEYLFYDWLEDRFQKKEDGVVEKSREMGATWTILGWALHHFLFDADFSCLVGSRKEDLVDNKLPDSLFGKLDYLISHLPFWLLPWQFNLQKHRTYMKIVSPTSHNAITGESTNPAFSRSGRYSAIIIDEMAFIDRSYSIWQAMGDSSPSRFAISTPDGKGNKFAELTHSGQTPKLTLHWRLHPEKDEQWYEKEKHRRTAQEVAQELDISYERSQRGLVFQDEWEELKSQGRLTDVPYDPIMPVYTSWDFGIGDATAIGFYQETRSGAIRMIDYYENSGKAIDHYIKVLQGKSYHYFQHYGDITIKRNELGTGKSVWEILRANNIFIRGKVVRSKNNAINASKMLMRKMWVDKKLIQFIDAAENYHFPFDEDKQVYGETPEHDWSSHAMDQLSYIAINIKSFQAETKRPVGDPSRYRHAATTY